MKAIYLLDTNVISEFAKKIPNEHVLERYYANETRCAIPAVVWQELIYGLEKMPEGKGRCIVADAIENLRSNMDVIPYDAFAAGICGELSARCDAAGTPSSYADTQIAATAVANNMILVTHNERDFAALCKISMLKIEDWAR